VPVTPVNSASNTGSNSDATIAVGAWEVALSDAQDAEKADINLQRPEDDKRSAQQIIDDSPLLKNLGNQGNDDADGDGNADGVKDMLRKRVGDFEHDPDAAYRAVQVLDHVEQFDETGNRIAGNDVGNGSIDGFTRSGDARNGTEAGRLQDFGKYGFSNLKGELNHVSSAGDDQQARAEAEKLGIQWERPEADKRSAKDIIDGDPLLKNLGNQSGVKDMLKQRVGDFETDANAAYRASQVLQHVEQFDADGKRLAGTDTGNGRIDGFTNSGEARNGTEAGRLQDFGKYGFANLKGKLTSVASAGDDKEARAEAEKLGIKWQRPDGDKRSAGEIITDNPLLANLGAREKNQLKTRVGDYETDADAAYRAVGVLNHIERFDETGKPIRGASTIGNGMLDGFTRAEDGDAQHGTEAGRFKDFVEQGFGSLKTADAAGSTDTKKLEELAKLMSDSIPDEDYQHFNDFMDELKSGAYYHIIQNANLPEDKRDMIAHPENYTSEQRGAAIFELSTMIDRMADGAENWSDYGFVYANNHFGSNGFTFNHDPAKVMEQISGAIDKLNSEDVSKWMDTAETQSMQNIINSSPELKKFAQDKIGDISKNALWLDSALGKGGDTLSGMRDYYALASSLNIAAGDNGKPFMDDFTINIKDTPQFETIAKEYDEKLGNEAVLTKLIEGGMSEDQAMAELNSRAALFAGFGSPVDEIGSDVSRNVTHHLLGATTQEQLKGIVLRDDGSLDEDKLNQTIDEIRSNDPDSAFLKDDNGKKLTNGQIVTAARNLWDSMRGTLKWNHTLLKDDVPGQAFLDRNNPLAKAYGMGALHFVSSLLAGGSMIAKASDGVKREEIPAVLGGAMQLFGGFGEGTALFIRSSDQRLNTLRSNWNALRPSNPLPADNNALKDKIGNVMDKLRTISATGGVLVLGASIAFGIEEAKKGNPAGAAVYFAGGVSQAATAPFAYTQALSRMIGPWIGQKIGGLSAEAAAAAASRVYNMAALWAGRVMTAFNPIAFLAAIGYAIYSGIEGDKKTEAYFEGFTPTLDDYGLDGDGAHDPWYDEDKSTGIS
jgi:hypothetical protein